MKPTRLPHRLITLLPIFVGVLMLAVACQPREAAPAEDPFVVADLFATPGKALATLQLSPTPLPTQTIAGFSGSPEPTLPLPTVVILLQPTLPIGEFAPTPRPPGAGGSVGGGPGTAEAPGTAGCAQTPPMPFTPAWQNIEIVRGTLRCPAGATQGFDGVYQPFERGIMFWRQSDRNIFIISLSSIRQGQATDTWWRIADTWQEGESESDASLVPPDGLSQPVRGFGKAWRNNGFVREALGWANGPEQFYTSQWLDFEGGWMMAAPDGATVYVLGADPGVSTGSHFGNFPR